MTRINLNRATWFRGLITLALFLAGWQFLAAAEEEPPPPPAGSPIHPVFPLHDRDGRNVLESGENVSTMQTCGGCHDVDFNSQHSFHADAGLGQLGAAGAGTARRGRSAAEIRLTTATCRRPMMTSSI